MLAFFQQYGPTILIIAALIVFFAFLLRSLIRDKKKGKSSCCGGCAGCAMAGQCHTQAKDASPEANKYTAPPAEEPNVSDH